MDRAIRASALHQFLKFLGRQVAHPWGRIWTRIAWVPALIFGDNVAMTFDHHRKTELTTRAPV